MIRAAAAASAGVTAFLLAIYAAYSTARFLTDAADGILKLGEVFRLTLLKSLIALEVLVPVGLYFGLIMALGQLGSHLEITAFHSCGVSNRRLQAPLIRFSLLLAVLVGLLSTLVRPWAYAEIYTLEARAEASSEFERIRSGRFYALKAGERTVFIDRFDAQDRRFHRVFVRSGRLGDLEVITARLGHLDTYVAPDRHRLTLEQASIFRQDTEGRDVSGQFGKLTIYLPTRIPASIAHRSKAKQTLTLRESVYPKDAAELQWRLSTPVSTLLLALLALRMGHVAPRAGRLARLPLALGVYAVYYNLTGIARSWVEQQTLTTLWWAPLLLALFLLTWSILARSRRWQ